MAGIRIPIDTREAEASLSRLGQAYGALGKGAVYTEQQIKAFEVSLKKFRETSGQSDAAARALAERFRSKLEAEKAKSAIDDLTKSLNLGRLEVAKLHAQAGDYSGALKTLKGSAEGAASGFDTIKKAAAAAGVAMAAYKVADYTKESAMAAARYETLGVAMARVGQNAGYTRQELDSTARSLQKQGISMIASRQGVMQLMQAEIDLSKATALATGAQDAAVIAGENSSDTFTKMVRGIQSGEVEILRNMGIMVNFEQAYKKQAKTLGTTSEALTENQKMQARLGEALEKVALIQGTYDAAMTTSGKKITSFTRYVEDYEVKMGEAFGPATGRLVDAATEAMKGLQEEIVKPEMQETLASIADNMADMATGIINNAVPALNAVMGGLREIKEFWDGVPDELKGPTGVGLVGAAMFGPKAGIVIGLFLAWKNQADLMKQGIDADKKGLLDWNAFLAADAEGKKRLLATTDTSITDLKKYVAEQEKVVSDAEKHMREVGDSFAYSMWSAITPGNLFDDAAEELKRQQDLLVKLKKELKSAELEAGVKYSVAGASNITDDLVSRMADAEIRAKRYQKAEEELAEKTTAAAKREAEKRQDLEDKVRVAELKADTDFWGSKREIAKIQAENLERDLVAAKDPDAQAKAERSLQAELTLIDKAEGEARAKYWSEWNVGVLKADQDTLDAQVKLASGMAQKLLQVDQWVLREKLAVAAQWELTDAQRAARMLRIEQDGADQKVQITRDMALKRLGLIEDLLSDEEHLTESQVDELYDIKREQLEKELADLKDNYGLTEEVARYAATRMRQLAEEEYRAKVLASDDWVAAIQLAYQDIEAATETWGRRFYDLTKETYSSAANVMGDMFFDVVKGQFTTLGDYMEAFLDSMLRSVTQTMAQVAMEFASSSLIKLGGGFLTSVIGELPFWHEGKLGPLTDEEVLSVIKKRELVIPEKQSSAIMAAMGSDGGGSVSKESFFDSIVGRIQGSASPWDVGNVGNPVRLGQDASLAMMRASVPTAMGIANYVQSKEVIDNLIASGALPESLRDQAMGLATQNALIGAASGIVHGVITGFMGNVISRSLGVEEYDLPATIISAGLGMLLGGPLAMGANLMSPFIGLGISGIMDAFGLRGNESTRDMLENLYGELGGRRMYTAAHNSLVQSIDSRGFMDQVLDSLKSSATMGILDTDPARFYDAPILGMGPWGSLQLQSLNYGTGEVVAQDIGKDFVGLTTNPDGSVLVGGQSWNIADAFTPAGMIEDLNAFNADLQDFIDEYDLGLNVGAVAADAKRVGDFNAWVAAILSINPDPRAQAAASATGVLSYEPGNVLTMDRFEHEHYNVGTGRVEVGTDDDPTRDDTSSGPDVGGNPQGGYSAGGAVDRLFQIPGMSPPAGDDGFAGLAYGEVVLTREQAARLRAMGALPGYAKGSGSDRGDPTYVLGDDTLPAWAKHFSDLDRALEALTANGIHLTQEGLRALMDQVDDNASSYKEYVKALKEGTDLTDKEKVNNDLAQREAQALADITGRYEGLNDILMEQAKLAADTARLEEIKAAEEAGWTKEQLKRLEEVQHLEDEAVKAQIGGDLELRRLRLEGHDLEASRLEQERSKQEALAQAIADGYSADQVAQLADMIDAEFAKGLADAAASFAADMGSRELTASGQTGEAERQGRLRDQADELEAAVSQFGAGSAEVARLLAVQAAENDALAESMAKSIDLYIAQVAGNEEGTAWMQLQEEHAQRWQEAIAAGVSDDVLGRLEEAMELENQQFEQERQHAAEIAALETKERTESLQVRMLRAQGLDGEADALALQMEQERELLEARQAGYTEEELALLAQVQAAEKLQAAAEGVADAVEDTTRAITEWDEERARIARALQAAKTGQSTEAYDYEYQVRSDQRNNVDRWSASIVNTQAALDRALTDGTSAENIANIRNSLAAMVKNRDDEAEILARMDLVYDSLLAKRDKEFRNLDVRALRATGQDDAADMAEELAKLSDEMDEAALKFDDEYTARLREVQALELLQWAQDKQADTIADLTDAYRDAADDLADTIRDLTYSEDLSTLDPGEKLAKLQAEFDALSAKALAGDAEAMAQLGGLSQEYLEARRGYYGSSGGYASEYERVMGILSTAQTMAETYAENPLTSEVYEEMSQAQLDQLAEMTDYMRQIADGDVWKKWLQATGQLSDPNYGGGTVVGLPGYASGGRIDEVFRIADIPVPAGDDGFIGARLGEQMLTPDQLANLSPARILDLSAPIGSAKGTVGGDASKEVVAAVNKLTAQFTSYRQQQADEQKEIRAQNTALIRENKELRLKAQRQAAK